MQPDAAQPPAERNEGSSSQCSGAGRSIRLYAWEECWKPRACSVAQHGPPPPPRCARLSSNRGCGSGSVPFASRLQDGGPTRKNGNALEQRGGNTRRTATCAIAKIRGHVREKAYYLQGVACNKRLRASCAGTALRGRVAARSTRLVRGAASLASANAWKWVWSLAEAGSNQTKPARVQLGK